MPKEGFMYYCFFLCDVLVLATYTLVTPKSLKKQKKQTACISLLTVLNTEANKMTRQNNIQ